MVVWIFDWHKNYDFKAWTRIFTSFFSAADVLNSLWHFDGGSFSDGSLNVLLTHKLFRSPLKSPVQSQKYHIFDNENIFKIIRIIVFWTRLCDGSLLQYIGAFTAYPWQGMGMWWTKQCTSWKEYSMHSCVCRKLSSCCLLVKL